MEFQIVDIHVQDEQAASRNERLTMVQKGSYPPCVVRIFGVACDARSVMVSVRGFKPSFYLRLPRAWREDLVKESNRTARDIQGLVSRLKACGWPFEFSLVRKYSLYGFYADPDCADRRGFDFFLEIRATCVESKRQLVSVARGLSLVLDGQVMVCEGAVTDQSLVSHFVHACKTLGGAEVGYGQWIGIERENMHHVPLHKRASRCKVELTCELPDIVDRREKLAVAPFMIASFDLECYRDRHGFPQAYEGDPIICAGVTTERFGQPGTRRRTVHFLRPDGAADHDVEDVRVRTYATERELIDGLGAQLCDDDVDAIIGYNTYNFDYAYLRQRAEMLDARGYVFSSKLRNQRLSYASVSGEHTTFKDAHGMGTRLAKEWADRGLDAEARELERLSEMCKQMQGKFRVLALLNTVIDDGYALVASLDKRGYGAEAAAMKGITTLLFDKRKLPAKPCTAGRVHIDLCRWIKSKYRLSNYSLHAVSGHFLQDDKVDLPYEEMMQLYRHMDPEGLRKIAVYCIKDCDLPLAIFGKLQVMVELSELSRVTSTSMHDISVSGEGTRNQNQIALHAKNMGFVLTYYFDGKEPSKEGSEHESDEKYQGATVLDPKVGFYDDHILVLDFASLYPSIILDHNLCFSTMLKDDEFTTASVDAVLPNILKCLLDLRKKTRRQQRMASGMEAIVLDKRQPSYKVSANSMYGYTGAGKKSRLWGNIMWGLPIAMKTTYYGRHMIERSAEIAGRHRVIYGDTDSIMVLASPPPHAAAGETEVERLDRVWKEGEQLGADITAEFDSEYILLEMEQVWKRLLLLAKKRYVALAYNSAADAHPTRVEKGVDTTRRDISPCARGVLCKMLNVLMQDDTAPDTARCAAMRAMRVTQATDCVEEGLRRLVCDELGIEDYVYTRSMRDGYKEVRPTLPHWTIYLKKVQRKEEPPMPGDRVPFLYIHDPPKLMFQRAEDPDYFNTHHKELHLKVDRLQYLDSLFKPVRRFLFFGCTDRVVGMFGAARHQIHNQLYGMMPVMRSVGTVHFVPPKKSDNAIEHAKGRTSNSIMGNLRTAPPPVQAKRAKLNGNARKTISIMEIGR